MNILPNEMWIKIALNLKTADMLKMNILSSSFHTLIKEYKIPDNNILSSRIEISFEKSKPFEIQAATGN